VRTVLVIVNGAAGGGRAEARLQPLLPGLAGAAVTVAHTSGPGHATELARAATSDAVVAVGGDGTLHEVVQGLMARAERPALGVVPVGTGNSFVRDLDLRDPARAVAAVAAGRVREVDVVRVTHADGAVYSVNLVSVGFAADAGSTTNRRYKGLGVAGYVAAVVQTLAGLRPTVVPWRADADPDAPFDSRPFVLLSFCNSSSTGGDMTMAPAADLSDGELDVVRIAPMGRRRFLTSFPRIFRGTHGELPEVTFGRARRVEFAPLPPVDVMIDGEVAALSLRSLEVVPRALRVLA
jgi:diacylglycerol kinase (ATP)